MAQTSGTVAGEHTGDTAPSCYSARSPSHCTLFRGHPYFFYGTPGRETRAPSYWGCGEGTHKNSACESAQQAPSTQLAPREHSRSQAVIVYYIPGIFRFTQTSQLSIYYVPVSSQVPEATTVNKIDCQHCQWRWGTRGRRGSGGGGEWRGGCAVIWGKVGRLFQSNNVHRDLEGSGGLCVGTGEWRTVRATGGRAKLSQAEAGLASPWSRVGASVAGTEQEGVGLDLRVWERGVGDASQRSSPDGGRRKLSLTRLWKAVGAGNQSSHLHMWDVRSDKHPSGQVSLAAGHIHGEAIVGEGMESNGTGSLQILFQTFSSLLFSWLLLILSVSA